jgi:uncharacterized protein Usg
MARTYN